MKRTSDRGDRDAGKVEVESHGFQVKCFIRLPCPTVQLRHQRAQRPQTLASSGLARRIARQQSQVRLQTTNDRLTQRQRQRGGGRNSGWNAALELILLTDGCRSTHHDQEKASNCESHGVVSPRFLPYRRRILDRFALQSVSARRLTARRQPFQTVATRTAIDEL